MSNYNWIYSGMYGDMLQPVLPIVLKVCWVDRLFHNDEVLIQCYCEMYEDVLK